MNGDRKSVPQPRRKCLVVAKFRSGAGAHRKSNKALRRNENQRLASSTG